MKIECQDLSSKVVEAVALKEEFARLSTTTEEMLQNLKTELQSEFNSVSEGLKEALGRCQDDPEGESGLKQLRAQATPDFNCPIMAHRHILAVFRRHYIIASCMEIREVQTFAEELFDAFPKGFLKLRT